MGVTLTAPWFCHEIDCPPFTSEDPSVDKDIELRSYEAGEREDHVTLNTTASHSPNWGSYNVAAMALRRPCYGSLAPIVTCSTVISMPRFSLSSHTVRFPSPAFLLKAPSPVMPHSGQWVSTNISDTSYDKAVRTGFWVSWDVRQFPTSHQSGRHLEDEHANCDLFGVTLSAR